MRATEELGWEICLRVKKRSKVKGGGRHREGDEITALRMEKKKKEDEG